MRFFGSPKQRLSGLCGAVQLTYLSSTSADVKLNALPRRPQLISGKSFNWREEAARSGSVLNDISAAMLNRSRSSEETRRVASWKPVVKVLPDHKFRVALIGCMNSGKTSLYNLLLRFNSSPVHKKSITNEVGGMTRDAVEGSGKLQDMDFTLIDSPGFVSGGLVEESVRSVETADIVLVVAAADKPPSADEINVSRLLKDRGIPSILVLNKMDLIPSDAEEFLLNEWRAADLGNALPISIRRCDGLDLLAAAIQPFFFIHKMHQTASDWDTEDAAMEGDESAMEEIRNRNSTETPIRVAFIGRTNAGKSSLINRLVGYERVRSSDKANTTRDPVEVSCVFNGRKLKLIDTPGLTRQRYRADREFLGRLHQLAINEVRCAHVVVIVFDATEGHPNKYDMSLIHTAASEGRPFLLCGNKWDAVLDQSAAAEAIDFKVKRQVKEVKYATAVVVSAETALNLPLLLEQVLLLYDTWNKRVRQAQLTKFWRKMEKSVIIPHHVTRVGRVTQVAVRPPTFLLQLQSRKESNHLPIAVQEMMKNALVEEFGFQGVPLRLVQKAKDSHPDYI